MVIKLLLLLAALYTCDACSGEKCETKTVKEGTCDIEVKECGCLFFPDTKYKATATEKSSGKSADKDRTSDKDKAYKEAVYDLFKKELTHDSCNPDQKDFCNCQHEDLLVGNCTIRATVCGYFSSEDDVKKGKISYQAWATDLATKKVGHVDDQKNATQAGTAAFQALVKGNPAEAACLAPPPAPPTPPPTPPAPGPPTPAGSATLEIKTYASTDCSGNFADAKGSTGQYIKAVASSQTAYLKFDMSSCRENDNLAICLTSDCKEAALTNPFKAYD